MTAGTYTDPDRVDRASLDLTGLRAHVRAGHALAAIRGIPRANLDLAAWHARQHHRSSAIPHVHRGRYVLILSRRGSVTGQIPRPLGWYTGAGMVTRAELAAEWRARAAEIGGA